MLKALLWKEWRTQRSLVLGGLALAASLPLFLLAGAAATATRVNLHEISRVLIPLYAMLVWPLFAAATAASAFAADAGDESLKFLLSRPVSRARVWFTKVGSGLAAFVAVVAITALFSLGIMWWSAASDAVFLNALRNDFGRSIGPYSLILAIPFVFVFACSVYCSLFARRPLAGALAGIGVAAGMVATIAFTWWRLVPGTSRVADNMLANGALTGMPLATLCVFMAAFWVFRRGDIFGGEGRIRAWQPLVAITVVVLLVGAVPAALAGLRDAAAINETHIGNLKVHDGWFVVPERTTAGLTTALVRRSVEGTAEGVVVPAHATFPVLSPNGDWVVYVSYEGYLGNLRDQPHLRAVRMEGSDDHAISGELPGWDWGFGGSGLLVAPDNDHVVFAGYADMLITTISGTPSSVMEFSLSEDLGVRRRRGGVIGWRAGQPAELLYYRNIERATDEPSPAGMSTDGRDPDELTELLAFAPASGESRRVQTFPGWQSLQVRGAGLGYYGNYAHRAWSWLPVWIEKRERDTLYLVDTGTGESIELSRSACEGWSFSADGSRFLYGNCAGTMRDRTTRAELRVYDLDSGADEPFAVLEGFDPSGLARELFWSPDGERLLFYSRQGYGQNWGTFIVSRDGPARPLSTSFRPVGWIDDDEALLLRDIYRDRELRRIDVDYGVARTLLR